MVLKLPEKATSRAVLIGVGRYADAGLPNVDTAQACVADLKDVLCGDYGLFDPKNCVEVADPRTSSNLHRPIREAAAVAEDVLLVYYVGHALRTEGRLLLLPAGAELDEKDTSSLSFDRVAKTLRTTRAAHVVVILDCCHSGTALDELGPSDAVGDAELIAAARAEIVESILGPGSNGAEPGSVRNVYLLASCGPHQSAAGDDGGGHTAFTGTLISVLTNGVAGIDTALLSPNDVLAEVARRLPETATSQRPCQMSRGGATEVLALARNADVLRRRDALGHDWSDQAAEMSDVWNCVRDKPAVSEAFQHIAVMLVKALGKSVATSTEAVRSDPWHNPRSLLHMLQYVGELLKEDPQQESSVANVRIELSAEEAALLVVAPFLYFAWRFRAVEALHTVEPTDLGRNGNAALPARADYETYLRFWPRRVERAVETGQCRAIGWWLFHSWLNEHWFKRPEISLHTVCGRFHETVTEEADHLSSSLQARVREAFDWDRILHHLVDALYQDPKAPEVGSSGHHEDAPGPRAGEVRLGLLTTLLTAARMMAVEPVRLPDILVDQLGSVRKMDLEEVRELAPIWKYRHRSWLLTTGPGHAVMREALRQHVVELDKFAAAVDRGESAVAAALPWRFQVRPDPGQASDSIRFSLSGPRVQELLGGTQLYGNPLLAVRELYQNAADANKQRANRGEFLVRTNEGRFTDGWNGRIEFTFGTEGGRTYLECRDNGVGMGLDELQRLFARGGSRREDIREFVDEQADWERAGFTPRIANSQFGIGVFSYFMIAESIRVRTCMFRRNGLPGESLHVDIDDPASLFRVEPSEVAFWGDSQTGTSVRLYLRPEIKPQAIAELLQEAVWVCEWEMILSDERELTAAEGRQPSLLWPAGDLVIWPTIPSTSASDFFGHIPPPARRLPPEAPHAFRSDKPVVHRAGSQVWWTEEMGGVLCDGVWIGQPLFGAVVNLTGRHMPRLTVNRSEPLHPDHIEDEGLLRSQISVLFEGDAPMLSSRWLNHFAANKIAIALDIADSAVARGHRWSFPQAHLEADAAVIGCFPTEGDRYFSQLLGNRARRLRQETGTGKALAPPSSADLARALTEGLPRQLARLRFLAWVQSGAFPGVRSTDTVQVPVASPADLFLLDGFGPQDDCSSWPPPALAPASAGHIAHVALTTGMSTERVRERLGEYGCSWTPVGERLSEPSRRDLVLLSQQHDALPPWLPSDAVGLGDVLDSAIQLNCRASEVVERCLELGLGVPACLLPDGAGLAEAEARGYVYVSNLLAAIKGSDDLLWLGLVRPLSIRQVLRGLRVSGMAPGDLLSFFEKLGLTVEPRAISYLPKLSGLPRDDLALLHEVMSMAEIPDEVLLEGLPFRLDMSRLFASPLIWTAGVRNVLQRLDGFVTFEAIGPPHENLAIGDEISVRHRNVWSALMRQLPAAVKFGRVELWQIAVLAAKEEIGSPEVARILTGLGLLVPDAASGLELDATDERLVSCSLDGNAPWLNFRQAPVDHVLAAERAGLPDPQARLIRLGFEVAQSTSHVRLGRIERILISKDLDGEAPLLDPTRPVEAGHLFGAVAELGRPIAEIIDLFASMGFQTPPELAAENLINTDETLIHAAYDAMDMSRDAGLLVSLDTIVRIARSTDRLLADVAARLSVLGCKIMAECVDELLVLPISEVGRFRHLTAIADERDVRFDDPLDFEGSPADDNRLQTVNAWFNHFDIIPAWHVLVAAAEAAMSPVAMRQYFVDRGFTVSDDVVFEDDSWGRMDSDERQ